MTHSGHAAVAGMKSLCIGRMPSYAFLRTDQSDEDPTEASHGGLGVGGRGVGGFPPPSYTRVLPKRSAHYQELL